MKYLVMKSVKSYAVLLDEEGRFIKSANLGYEVGDTVENPVLMRDEPLEKVDRKKRSTNKVVTAIVAIAAMISIFFGVNYYQENLLPHTSIFMIINPEVEMILNKKGAVIDLAGANPDGVELLEGFEPSSQDRIEVVNELVDRAIEMGFLADGGQVSIAIDTPDQELFEQYGIELRQELDGRTTITIQITDIENRIEVPVETPVYEHDEDDWDDDDWDDDDWDDDDWDDDDWDEDDWDEDDWDEDDWDEDDWDDDDWDDDDWDDDDWDDDDWDDDDDDD